MFCFIVLSIICAAALGAISHSVSDKGCSAWTWSVLGLALPVVATVILGRLFHVEAASIGFAAISSLMISLVVNSAPRSKATARPVRPALR